MKGLPGARFPAIVSVPIQEGTRMTYADDPERLARLLNDLAAALEASGVNASGSSSERHLMDAARAAARELDPPKPRSRPGKLRGF